jgi:hypothetical protein
LILAVGLSLTACPHVSCNRKAAQTDFLSGPYGVPVKRVEGCTFEVTDGFVHGAFPRSRDGFYSVEANGFPQSWTEISFDAGEPTFTVHGRECERGIVQMDVKYFRWARTANE